MQLMEACLAVLEREEERQDAVVEGVYRPAIPALFRIPNALVRMRRQLAGLTEPTPLTAFLPKLPNEVPNRDLVACSAVSSTLVAALELARLNEMSLGEDSTFEHIMINAVPSQAGVPDDVERQSSATVVA